MYRKLRSIYKISDLKLFMSYFKALSYLVYEKIWIGTANCSNGYYVVCRWSYIKALDLDGAEQTFSSIALFYCLMSSPRFHRECMSHFLPSFFIAIACHRWTTSKSLIQHKYAQSRTMNITWILAFVMSKYKRMRSSSWTFDDWAHALVKNIHSSTAMTVSRPKYNYVSLRCWIFRNVNGCARLNYFFKLNWRPILFGFDKVFNFVLFIILLYW